MGVVGSRRAAGTHWIVCSKSINRLTPEIKFAITCAYSEIVYKKS